MTYAVFPFSPQHNKYVVARANKYIIMQSIFDVKVITSKIFCLLIIVFEAVNEAAWYSIFIQACLLTSISCSTYSLFIVVGLSVIEHGLLNRINVLLVCATIRIRWDNRSRRIFCILHTKCWALRTTIFFVCLKCSWLKGVWNLPT